MPWHWRLDHLGPDVLSQLSCSTITCPRASSESLCHACQLGRQVRLHFPSSFRVVRAFDLIHCDLWTFVFNIFGYKYSEHDREVQ
jgi:hypothetical protein